MSKRNRGHSFVPPHVPRPSQPSSLPVTRICCWVDCDTVLDRDDCPLCTRHLVIAHRIYVSRLDDTAPVLRHRHVVSAPEPKPEKKTEVAGTIYFIRSGGFVKIGWTSDLARRMKGYPPDTLLLAVKPGTRKGERALHRKFAHLKTHGREWFPLAPQITEEIDRTVAEHGEPPAVDFVAKRVTHLVGPRWKNPVGGNRIGNGPLRFVRGG